MDYLTVAEAARRTSLSERYIRQLVSEGILEASRAGELPASPIRISEEAIDAYMKARVIRRPAAQPAEETAAAS